MIVQGEFHTFATWTIPWEVIKGFEMESKELWLYSDWYCEGGGGRS